MVRSRVPQRVGTVYSSSKQQQELSLTEPGLAGAETGVYRGRQAVTSVHNILTLQM